MAENWVWGLNAGLLVGGVLSRIGRCPWWLIVLLSLAMVGGMIFCR